ncbi:MAG: response regulator [Deltaproteobacteria bacterium]|nr:response regulator [Deltaproteobacteria bacterium]
MAGSARVLLVEDEATLRGILQAVLDAAGHLVTPVTTAEEAVQKLGAEKFDVLLTDKNLPGISGLELMAEAQRLAPGLRVMLITGYPSVGAAVEALDAGFLSFLVKPLRQLQEVGGEVARVLAIPAPMQRHARTLALRNRLQGDREALPPLSALIISESAQGDVLAGRLGAPHTVRARDLSEAQMHLGKSAFAAVVSTELTALIEARARLPEAALVFCGDASFADVLELIRLGAGLMAEGDAP